jgi:hypothetical protein
MPSYLKDVLFGYKNWFSFVLIIVQKKSSLLHIVRGWSGFFGCSSTSVGTKMRYQTAIAVKLYYHKHIRISNLESVLSPICDITTFLFNFAYIFFCFLCT